MRKTSKFLILVCLVGWGTWTLMGCGDSSSDRVGSDSQETRRDEFAESSEDFERELEDITRELERDLERNQRDIERAQRMLEERLERTLNDEEMDKLRREIELSVQTGLAAVGETLEKIGARLKEDAKVEVVDYREFKELMPERVAGFRMINQNGTNKSALGIRFSKLEANYENGDNHMELAIFDLGTMKGLTAMGFDWVDRKIDNEDADGFEKTTKFGGYPGFESAQYNGNMTSTQGVVIVENRFVVSVNIEGKNLDKALLSEVFDDISFRSLRRLAN